MMLRQPLIGSQADPAHAEDDDFGVTGVARTFLRVQLGLVLRRQSCGDLLDHQVAAPVDQRRYHETQSHRDGHLHQPRLVEDLGGDSHRHDDQPELRVVHQAQPARIADR